MKDKKDLSEIIAKKGDNPLTLSIANLQPKEDAELERKLRELKFKQELRKDWILFIVRDVVIFPAAILFIVAVSGYSLFTQINR
jgi:nitrate reductase NapE component